MTSQWMDPEFVWKWDQSILLGNPIRCEQIDIMLSIIEKAHRPGGAVLDIGMGSGQIEEQLLKRITDVTVVGVDISPPMLDLARNRLSEFSGRYHLIEHDYNDLGTLELEHKEFQAGVCFDVIHHAQHSRKIEVFEYFHDHLVEGGILFYGDKVIVDLEKFGEIYKVAWERLENKADIKSGRDGERYLSHIQKHKNNTLGLKAQMEMIESVGFSCACIYLHLDRVLITCLKI